MFGMGGKVDRIAFSLPIEVKNSRVAVVRTDGDWAKVPVDLSSQIESRMGGSLRSSGISPNAEAVILADGLASAIGMVKTNQTILGK
jgi:hypothetical protein